MSAVTRAFSLNVFNTVTVTRLAYESVFLKGYVNVKNIDNCTKNT